MVQVETFPNRWKNSKKTSKPNSDHKRKDAIEYQTSDGTARSPDFTVAVGAAAGSVSQSFDGIPARSVCTVNEIADGATATVAVNVSGQGRKVSIPAGKVVPVNVMDVYQRATGD